MTIPIFLFAILMLFAGVLLLRDPEIIFGFLRNNIENPAIHITAVVVRLIIGTLLITQASLSKFQIEVEVIGGVLIVAGFILAVIGRRNFRKSMSSALKKSKLFGRLAGVVSIVFGGLLIYAFL